MAFNFNVDNVLSNIGDPYFFVDRWNPGINNWAVAAVFAGLDNVGDGPGAIWIDSGLDGLQNLRFHPTREIVRDQLVVGGDIVDWSLQPATTGNVVDLRASNRLHLEFTLARVRPVIKAKFQMLLNLDWSGPTYRLWVQVHGRKLRGVEDYTVRDYSASFSNYRSEGVYDSHDVGYYMVPDSDFPVEYLGGAYGGETMHLKFISKRNEIMIPIDAISRHPGSTT